jgi:nicotinate-nucleotide adenylyltransferase
MRRLRIGLLCGSFNPAHEGHLHISRLALQRLRLDYVWWLVSPQNPLKPVRGMAALAERLRTAHAIARGHPRVRVSAIEARLGTRYTVDTLAALRRHFPATRFVWLMGADNLAQIPRWRGWSRIFHLVAIAVFARGSYGMKALAGMAAKRFRRFRVSPGSAYGLAAKAPPAWAFLPTPLHAASATAIRAGRPKGTTRGLAFNDRRARRSKAS